MGNVIGIKEDFYTFLPPFAEVGTVYDSLMDFVNYKEWVDYIEKVFLFFGKNPKTILDIGCGTGTATILFAKKGYRITGMDIADSMLKTFKNKIKKDKIKLDIIKGDMRNIPINIGTFDAAISMFDTINYNLTEAELKSTFKSIYRILNPGGIFIFDVNTIHCLETVWGNGVMAREGKGVFSIWKNTFDAEKNISTLFLTIFKQIKPNIYRRFDEVHKERGYELEEITEYLEETGFYSIRYYKHLSFLPGKEDSLRVNFVALKEK